MLPGIVAGSFQLCEACGQELICICYNAGVGGTRLNPVKTGIIRPEAA